MSTAGVNECPEDSQVQNEGSEKRQITLTVKALALKIEGIQKERQAKIKKLKGLMSTTNDLMQNQNEQNVKTIQSQLENCHALFKDATRLHNTVVPMLPPEEQEKQNTWFTKVHEHNTSFIEKVTKWLSETEQSGVAEEHAEPSVTAITQEDEDAPANVNATSDGNVDVMENSAEQLDDDVKPTDSISNFSSHSNTSRRSNTSSTRAARKQAEAEMAALMARQKWLQDKHALEEEEQMFRKRKEEEEQMLRKRKEKLALAMDIAANAAKLKVLGVSDSCPSGVSKGKSNGMNSYLERERKRVDLCPLNVEAETFVPKASVQQQPYHTAAGEHLLGAKPKVKPSQAIPFVQPPTLKVNMVPQTQVTHTYLSAAHPKPQITHHTATPGMQSSEPKDLTEVLQKQNEITSMLVEQQYFSLLPKRDIQTFDGDPLQYQTFIRSFEHNIEQKTFSARDRLYFLEQYTRGQPRELVRGCEHMPEVEGYIKAKSLLQEQFGNPMKIASAYMGKIIAWPVIKSEDLKSLQAYSIFLRQCNNAMRGIHFSLELDAPSNMQTVIKKLPYKLKERWREEACTLQETSKRRASFRDIVQFVEKQVKIASDPLFGDLMVHDTPGVGKRDVRQFKSQPYSAKPKGSSFATTISPMNKGTQHNMKSAYGNKSNASPVTNGCLFCGAGHTLDMCFSLERKAHSDKMAFLKENGVCYGCLCIGHRSRDCTKRLFCKVCNLRHPTLLHIHSKQSQPGTAKSNQGGKGDSGGTSGSGPISVQSSGLTGAGERDCTLAILPVRVKSTKGNEVITTYAFLDPGSSASFCTERLMNRLNVTGKKTGILLRTMGQEKVVSSHIVTNLEIAGLDTDCFCALPELFTQKCMPVHRGNIPKQEDLDKWTHLKDVKLTEIDSEVDLLIGTNVPRALEPWEVIRGADRAPYGVKTVLGWTVNGPLRGDCTDDSTSERAATVSRISIVTLDDLWEQQVKLDFPECAQDEQQGLSREGTQFMESAKESVKLLDGHYSIGLPLRKADTKMPNNRNVAVQRALSLKRRLTKDSLFHTQYTDFMSDMMAKGYAERVPLEDLGRSDGRVWYLPHHGVIHPQKKKLRVVFDCAATFQGTSLNAQLLQGPDLTSSLVGVITRFRREPVVLMADITAMFHQVRVPRTDSDLLRFLWWPDGEHDQDLVEHRMVVHLFGATSSPSCASYALRKCAEDNQDLFSQTTADTVLNNFYVDDCLASVGSEEEALTLYRELCELCKKGGFQLTKWISNSRKVLAAIPQEERSLEVKDLDLDSENLPVERALGVQWCVQSDSFRFKITLRDRPLTRRGILSVISSIYDPLGFLSPVGLVAKRILQSLCRCQLGWDDSLPAATAQEWTAWLEELQQLDDFKVVRCFKPPGFGEVSSTQLHHFADASEDGYGTVTYLLQQNIHGQTHCAFVMGKARVAPLKPVTIPRMELTAAVMASRMDKLWRKELKMPLQQSVFWSDSTSVLKYINNKTSRFKTFVANRVAEILSTTETPQWRYVNTSSNPADLASRGTRVSTFLKSEAWLLGPSFLMEPEAKWPENIELSGKLSAEDPEVKTVVSVLSVVSVNAVRAEEQSDPLMRFIPGDSPLRTLLVLDPAEKGCWLAASVQEMDVGLWTKEERAVGRAHSVWCRRTAGEEAAGEDAECEGAGCG